MIPDESHVLVIRQQCVFCAKAIEPDEPSTAILIGLPGPRVRHKQLDAHLDCVKNAAHPEMAKLLDLDEIARKEQTLIVRLNKAIEAMPWWKRWRSRRHLRALGLVPSDPDA